MTLDEFLAGPCRYVRIERGECTLIAGYGETVAIGYGKTADEAIAHALAVYEVRRKLEK